MALGFPGFRELNRQTVRAPVNPLDLATIVSIFPRAIHENKVSIQPGIFNIPAGSVDKPGVLEIQPSSWWKDVSVDEPLLEIPVSAVRIADSIIKDYCNGILGVDQTNRMLGLFYVPGSYSVERVKKELQPQLIKAQQLQKAWYAEIVRITDILWAQSNGNPIVVSDDAKLAASEIGMKDKVWLKDSITLGMTTCPACGYLVNPGFPVCANCKTIINQEAYDKMGLKAS